MTAVCESCLREEVHVTHEVDTTVLHAFCLEHELLSGVSGEEDKIVNVDADLYWSFGSGGGAYREHRG